MFDELFNGPTSVFAASLVPELFTGSLENSQREQTSTCMLVQMNVEVDLSYQPFTMWSAEEK